MEIDLSVVREVKRRHRFDILLKTNVIGVGIGYKLDREHKYPPKTPCMTVMVYPKLPPAELAPTESIAPVIKNCLTDVVEAAPTRMGFTIRSIRRNAGTEEKAKASRWRTEVSPSWMSDHVSVVVTPPKRGPMTNQNSIPTPNGATIVNSLVRISLQKNKQ